MAQSFSELANFIWGVAGLLRGDYRQSDYGKVVLPFVLHRRLECVLDGTRDEVRKEYVKRKDSGVNLDPFLKRKSAQAFYCVSEFTLPTLLDDPKHIRQSMVSYIGDFKDVLTGIVIDAQDAQNSIADQLLKDERIFGVMQRMLAKMVWQQFQRGTGA